MSDIIIFYRQEPKKKKKRKATKIPTHTYKHTHTDGLINDQNSSFYFVFLHTLGKKTHQTDTYNIQKDVVQKFFFSSKKKDLFLLFPIRSTTSVKNEKKRFNQEDLDEQANIPNFFFFFGFFPIPLYSFFIIND